MLASNLIDELGPVLKKGHDFIKKSQVLSTSIFCVLILVEYTYTIFLLIVQFLLTKILLFDENKILKVTDNPSGDFKGMFRHISKGSWTFSDQDHGWQVSDCTAEGLKVLIFPVYFTNYYTNLYSCGSSLR